MTNFLVIVTCAAHLHSCPIPQGYRAEVQVNNIEQCKAQATRVIAAFGYSGKDFHVRCSEKR